MSLHDRRRLIAAAIVQAAAGVALFAVDGRAFVWPSWALMAILFAAAGCVRVELDHPRGRCIVTPSQAVLVVAFGVLPVAGVALAAAVGEALSLAVRRLGPLKIGYNAASRLLAAAAAAAVFEATATSNGVSSWPWALLAAAVFSSLNVASTSLPLAMVERKPIAVMARRTAPTALLSAAIAAPLGLVIAELTRVTPWASLVLAPVGVALFVNFRAASAGRAEHQLVAGLYTAMHDNSRLRSAEETSRTVAEHAVELLVATDAVVLWRNDGAAWSGASVGDTAFGDVEHLARSFVEQLAVGEARLLDGTTLDFLRGGSVLAARVCAERIDVIVAVARRTDADAAFTSAHETMRALAAQAALALQNSALLEEAERSLARQVDLNRQKSEFVATVSHELRTPLAAMLGLAETIHIHGAVLGADVVHDYAGRSIDQGTRLQRLIDDLLTVAAAEHAVVTTHVESVKVDDALDDVRRTTSAAGVNRLELASTTDPRTMMRTDRDRVVRILVNLIDNAVKYSDGVIRLSTGVADGGVRFDVDDEGDGVPDGDVERIFEPFVQLDQSQTRARGGAGLGLHLCRQLTHALGGSITYARSPLGGARFSLWMPVADGDVVEGLLEEPPVAADA